MHRASRSAAGVGAVVVSALLLATPARAGDPSLAEYVADGSRVFWFLWITDSHIDYVLPLVGPGGEEDRLRWIVDEGVDVVQPWFVVNTGDLTDGTDGIRYTGRVESEWLVYRGILDDAGMTPEIYFDVAGNHDAYSDGALEMYLAHSVQGLATGGTQPSWRLDLAFGAYHFVAVATPGNDGSPWPIDNTQLTAEELTEVDEALAANADARLSMVFGHHDFVVAENGGSLRGRLMDAGVGHYFHGHEHNYGVRLDGVDGIVRLRIDSLGQGWSDGTFAVVAVDADALSLTPAAAEDAWPLVVITAPVDAHIGPSGEVANPYAPPVPASCAEAPVRALVFDAVDVVAVRFRWDGGASTDMVQRTDLVEQWRGRFDAASLGVGWHALTVEAEGSSTRSVTIQVEVVDAACDVGDEDPDPGADGDADADADADGDADAVGDADPDSPGGPDGDADADADGDADADPEDDEDPPLDGDGGDDDEGGDDGCSCRAPAPRGGPARSVFHALVGL